jgi:hypothetical protein
LSNTKDRIISLLEITKRPGIEKVIEYLNTTDFFTAPASTKYHNAFEEGLAEHSLNVWDVLGRKNGAYGNPIPPDSETITALLHDLCKTNFYKKEMKNVKKGTKDNGWGKQVANWVEEEVWVVDDKEPMGHGEKSLWLLSKMIELTDQEAYLIRYHMGFTEPKDNWMHLNNALDKYPEIILLHTADLEATYMIEGREKK